MKKISAAAVTVIVAALSGCAVRGPDSEALSATVNQHKECLNETAIDAAYTSDDFAYVQGVVRAQCRHYEQIAINQFNDRQEASNHLEITFTKAAQDATAHAITLLKNKNEYLLKFYKCSLDKTTGRILTENPQSVEELTSMSKADITSCYDAIMSPYLGVGNNTYSAQRKKTIIDGTTRNQVKLIIDMERNAQKRKAQPAQQRKPRLPQEMPEGKEKQRVWKL